VLSGKAETSREFDEDLQLYTEVDQLISVNFIYDTFIKEVPYITAFKQTLWIVGRS